MASINFYTPLNELSDLWVFSEAKKGGTLDRLGEILRLAPRLIPPNRIWPPCNLFWTMYERVFEKFDFCICDSIRSQPLAWLEVEVKGSLIKFVWPLVSQKNPLRRCQQELEVQGLLCPPLALYVSLLFFLPLILISSKYLLNSRGWGNALRFGSWSNDQIRSPCTRTSDTQKSKHRWNHKHAWKLRFGSDTVKEAQTKTLPDVYIYLLWPPLILSSLTFAALLNPSRIIYPLLFISLPSYNFSPCTRSLWQ